MLVNGNLYGWDMKVGGMMMVEKVARAILAARGIEMRALPDDALWLAYNKEVAFAEARAAIEAMREPDEVMCKYAGDVLYALAPKHARAIFVAMIDAALSER